MQILKDIFTEVDNTTFDLAKILSFLGISISLVLAIVSFCVYKTPFSMQDFGVGFGALLTGVGVILKLKKESGDS